MSRVSPTSAGIVAGACALLVSASVVVLSATVIGGHIVSMQQAKAHTASSEPATFAVNRDGKGDKLPASEVSHVRAEIKSVEVIGVTNASIVYRDRDGNVLYRTDPLANVTVVTKNVELPEVTIRENETVEIERVPVEEAETPRSAQPHGCESAFARPSPESLTRMSSRCVTDLSRGGREFAAN